MLYLLFTIVASYDYAGRVTPTGSLSVSNSLTNRNIYANYTFTFTLGTSLPANSIIAITFPAQFDTRLGVAGDPICEPYTCSISDKTISLTMPTVILSEQELSVKIQKVKNPDLLGGTGNFQISTYYWDYLLDTNRVFGSLGISETPVSLKSTSVGLVPDKSKIAGDLSELVFNFKVSLIIPAGSWIALTFPDSGFLLTESPTCTSSSDGKATIAGELVCQVVGRELYLTGISSDIAAGTEASVRVTTTLPEYSLTTAAFELRMFRENTNTLYEMKTGIAGVYIEPGFFYQLEFSPVESGYMVTRGKTMLYRLIVELKNPVEEYGVIRIDFPVSFVMGGEFIKYIESGLADISSETEVSLEYSIPNRQLLITNFAQIQEETIISMVLQLENPSTSGTSAALTISTMRKNQEYTIDTDSTSATTVVSSLLAPGISVSLSNTEATGAAVVLQVTITPHTQIPAGGFITVLVPKDFDGSSPICELEPWNVGKDFAASCSLSAG